MASIYAGRTVRTTDGCETENLESRMESYYDFDHGSADENRYPYSPGPRVLYYCGAAFGGGCAFLYTVACYFFSSNRVCPAECHGIDEPPRV